MARKREKDGKAERDAQKERARQLRERIGGLAGKREPKTPRELTDEAAMRVCLDENEQSDDGDGGVP